MKVYAFFSEIFSCESAGGLWISPEPLSVLI